jgi:hypothetical protein
MLCDNLDASLTPTPTMDSFELQDEIQALQDIQNYSIPNEYDIHSEDPARLLAGEILLFLPAWYIRMLIVWR